MPRQAKHSTTFSHTFRDGDLVYHNSFGSPRGRIIDTLWSTRDKITTYIVSFGIGQDMSLREDEIQKTKPRNNE